MRRPLIAVPIKPFGVAKRRLATVLDASTRSIVGREVAARTLDMAGAAGGRVVVVTADGGVRAWAARRGVESTGQSEGGLIGAAMAAVAMAHGAPWVVAHADLPLVDTADFEAIVEAVEECEVVLAPSFDGGTTVVAGTVASFPFSYGPGSFRRHLAVARERARIVVRLGLALDLDGPSDLSAALRHPRGSWLRELLRPSDDPKP
jgi:2-phospho-L-lactate guanylyltransferase